MTREGCLQVRCCGPEQALDVSRVRMERNKEVM